MSSDSSAFCSSANNGAEKVIIIMVNAMCFMEPVFSMGYEDSIEQRYVNAMSDNRIVVFVDMLDRELTMRKWRAR